MRRRGFLWSLLGLLAQPRVAPAEPRRLGVVSPDEFAGQAVIWTVPRPTVPRVTHVELYRSSPGVEPVLFKRVWFP